MFLGDESQLNPHTTGKSNDVELKQSTGLQKQNQLNSRSTGSNDKETLQYDGNEVSDFSPHSQLVVDHHNPAALGAQDGGWIARLAALLVEEDPTQYYALICGSCHMHNGLARKEEFPFITYYCPYCHALNKPKNSDERSSGTITPSTITSADVNLIKQNRESTSEKVPTTVSSDQADAVEEQEESEKIVPGDPTSH